MKTTHVTNISNSAHTGHGIYMVDATDKNSVKLPDFRSIVSEYRSVNTGSLLFKHCHSVRSSQWFDRAGILLQDHEIPVILTVSRFEQLFGGAEYCDVI